MSSIITGIIVRHLLSGIGGAVAATGYATNDDITAITGGVTALAAVAASWWNKRKKAK